MSQLFWKIIKFSSVIELFSIYLYIGCYRFSDGSFMKYLNYNETKLKLRISAPIFKENDKSCYVRNRFKFIQNGQEWKDGRNSPFYININDDTKELKVNRNGSPSYLTSQLINIPRGHADVHVNSVMVACVAGVL